MCKMSADLFKLGDRVLFTHYIFDHRGRPWHDDCRATIRSITHSLDHPRLAYEVLLDGCAIRVPKVVPAHLRLLTPKLEQQLEAERTALIDALFERK
jgi:hypothetical protein